MADDEEDEPLGGTPTRAELMIQHLLDRQLATSGRLEQVEFKSASRGLYRGIHGSGGVSTLAEFLTRQNDEENNPQPSHEPVKCKRRRYGANPVFLEREQMVNEKNPIEESHTTTHTELGRHEKELELSLIKGKGRLQDIAHLTVEGLSYRKPLIELSEAYKGTTPEDRARESVEKNTKRSPMEVFSASAPPLLELSTYLESKASVNSFKDLTSDRSEETPESQKDDPAATQIPEETILANRLSLDAIREWSNGKFRKHAPGVATNALYLKNLSSEVTEKDLACLFLRYQKPGNRILFRLMQKGRMKGQAFVTFPDVVTATHAMKLVDGYMLKGRPVVIEYARGTTKTE